MRILHIAPEGWQKDLEPALEKLGHEIVDKNPDVIIVKSITQMKKSVEAYQKYPKALKIQYNWDVYSWALNNLRAGEYDYKKYRALCLMSDEVWVPSKAVQRSLKEFWNMESVVIKSFAPQYPLPEGCEVKNEGYALQALRKNPDKHIDWFERACKETGIDYEVVWAKELTEEQYRPILAHAGFLVSAIYEMSTGGQFLTEGAFLGKPILASNSPYVGASDYFGDTIAYYQHDDFDDLKDKMLKMFKGELKTDVEEAKEIVKGLTPDYMAKLVDKRLKQLV